MSKTTKRIIIGMGFLIVVLALSYPKVKPLLLSDASGAPQQSNSSALKVDGVIIKPGSVQDKIFTTGTIMANEEVELRSEASGKITTIHFEEGSRVKKGQLLLKINDSELQAQLTRAKYRLDLATERESRQKKLLEKGGISQEDYDATLNEVNVLKSEAALIEAQIEKTEIRAPFDGRIGLKYVSEGSYISPSTRIASLQDIDPVKIDFSVPERYVNTVEVGDAVTFTVQGTDETFQGDIYAIEPRINSDTRTLQIRAKSDNQRELLVPGAFADLELILNTIDDALMLPTIALVPELEGQKVYLYQQGSVAEQSVQTGIRTEQKVQVTEGLQPGDTVLTTGLLQVRTGMAVEMNELQ